MANLCIGVLCTAARECKAATEETTEETADDAVYKSFEGWCTLRGLTVAAASKVIFGVDNDSKRLRGACKYWVGRRKLNSPAVQEAAKGVRARAPSRPRPA